MRVERRMKERRITIQRDESVDRRAGFRVPECLG